ncbi:unnamed protein product [Sphagnum troendelagicum]|uniref:Uncharacterized protein n=1 Tax=Sphagnum troendelagicum TaxID=128251 RepID=A0ABP0UWH7_9BRYO
MRKGRTTASRSHRQQITAAEIAGFSVSALRLIAALAAPKVDSFVVHSQHRFSLWNVEECECCALSAKDMVK